MVELGAKQVCGNSGKSGIIPEFHDSQRLAARRWAPTAGDLTIIAATLETRSDSSYDLMRRHVCRTGRHGCDARKSAAENRWTKDGLFGGNAGSQQWTQRATGPIYQ